MNVLFCFAAVLFICSGGVVFSSQQGSEFCAQGSVWRELPFKILDIQRKRIAVNLSLHSSCVYFAFEAVVSFSIASDFY